MKVIDLHCDTLYECTVKGKDFYHNDLHISIDRAEKYDKYIQCFAAWMPDEFRGQAALTHFDKCFECYQKQLSLNKNNLKKIEFYEDLKEFEKSDVKVGSILTVEGGSALAGQLQNVDHLFDCGVRIMTLTWNGDNEIAGGVMGSGGLTEFGKNAVRRMEELGIIVDVSHLNDRSFDEVMEFADRPVIATHSNLRSICSHKRNLTDDRLKKLTDKGGIVGLNFYRLFLENGEKADIDSIYRMVDGFMERGGESFLCLGSDFDGCDLPDDIVGIEDIKKLYEYLLVKGYGQTVLDNIFYNNANDFLLKHLPRRNFK